MFSKKPLILVVDDDKDFGEIAKTKLEANGFSVQLLLDSTKAKETVIALSPAVVLMDVKMPAKDGVDAALDLVEEERTKKTPVIFLTSLGDEHFTELNRRLSQQIGARDYFKKGGDYEMLVAKIRKLIA